MSPSTRKPGETRRFGRTGLEITRIGLGTWAIGGGGWAFGWGPQDDESSRKTIRRAMELGLNWIDTAPVYGTGHSEEVVGEAVKGLRARPYIFTKVSLVWDAGRRVRSTMKAQSVRREVDESRRRLGVPALDLAQVHWPEPEAEIEEGWRTLAELKDEGKVRHIGVSNFSVAQMERAEAIAPVETLQSPFSLIHPELRDEILPYCRSRGIGVIVYSPMVSGLLSGTMSSARVKAMAKDDWRRKGADFRGPRLERNLALAALCAEVGKAHGASAGEVAIAWTLRAPAVTAAIVGARSPQQVEGFVGAPGIELTPGEVRQLEDFPLEE